MQYMSHLLSSSLLLLALLEGNLKPCLNYEIVKTIFKNHLIKSSKQLLKIVKTILKIVN